MSRSQAEIDAMISETLATLEVADVRDGVWSATVNAACSGNASAALTLLTYWIEV